MFKEDRCPRIALPADRCCVFCGKFRGAIVLRIAIRRGRLGGEEKARCCSEPLPEFGFISPKPHEAVVRIRGPHSDRAADQKRLRALYSKRLSRKKLTPEEDAEEAHLAVRVLKPEGDESLKLPIVLWLSKLSMEIEWPTTRIAELDERVVGGETLTAAEEAERQDLRRRYPDSAAEADRIDHRYRYCFRKEMEIAEKAGMKYSKAYDAAKEKCEPLRDPTKIPRADLRSGINPRIRELETLRWDNILTPEEADELAELHRRYPDRAEKTRKFVDRRLSYDRANRDNMRRTGSDPGPIKEDGWPRFRTPTGRMAGR